jgi:hypothetical protein
MPSLGLINHPQFKFSQNSVSLNLILPKVIKCLLDQLCFRVVTPFLLKAVALFGLSYFLIVRNLYQVDLLKLALT